MERYLELAYFTWMDIMRSLLRVQPKTMIASRNQVVKGDIFNMDNQ